MIRPSAEDINAIVETTREWPADARARLVERLERDVRDTTAGAIRSGKGPTAAEIIIRFGTPGSGPSDDTIRLWIREHKEAQADQ